MFRRVVLLLFVCLPLTGAGELAIWKEFVAELKGGSITEEQIRPYAGLPKKAILEVVSKLGRVSAAELDATPEIHRVGDRVHFLIPLGGRTKSPFCFSFLTEGDRWYFQHVENITIRLDELGALPTSKYPDIPEYKKAWQRHEWYWSEQVQLFKFHTEEKGRDFAWEWVRRGVANGPGYALTAKASVPLVAPEKAFVLYLCWEQANLWGNVPSNWGKYHVTLEKLEEDEAIVRMQLMYFNLYERTGHLRHLISKADFRQIFETIWRERAKAAGWSVQIDYEGDECIFHLTPRSGPHAGKSAP